MQKSDVRFSLPAVVFSLLSACSTPIDAPVSGGITEAQTNAQFSDGSDPVSVFPALQSVQEGALSVHEDIVATDPHQENRRLSALVEFAAGLNTQTGEAVATAGVINSDVGAPVIGGFAQYHAEYNYVVLDDVRIENDRIAANAVQPLGNQSIVLDADFDAGTLTGRTFDLDVAGTISGSAVGGSVTVTPQIGVTANGRLQGQIGEDGVAAAFVGASDTSVLAGGLVGVRQ